MVNREPLTRRFDDSEYELQLIHTASGTHLYREDVHLMDVAHGDPNQLVWGVRIPAFKATGLRIAIMDKEGSVVLEQGIESEAK